MEANAMRSVAPRTRTTAKAATGDLVRVIAASTAGSAMEWYDFSIYGTASALIKSVGTLGITVAAGLAVVTIPRMGWLSDRFGRRIMYRLAALFACAWAFPAFWLFNTKDPVWIIVGMSVAIGVGVVGMYGIQGPISRSCSVRAFAIPASRSARSSRRGRRAASRRSLLRH